MEGFYVLAKIILFATGLASLVSIFLDDTPPFVRVLFLILGGSIMLVLFYPNTYV